MNAIDTLNHIFSNLLNGIINIMRFGVIYIEVVALIVIVSTGLLVMVMHGLGYDREVLHRLRKLFARAENEEFGADALNSPLCIADRADQMLGDEACQPLRSVTGEIEAATAETNMAA